MIVGLKGKLVEKKEMSLTLDVNGVVYEVYVPASVLQRVDENLNDKGEVQLVIYHYLQISPSAGIPLLVGFCNEIERDFFLHFIKVSGIGPKAAVKALNKPIEEITQAIEHGDAAYLKTLPGIGMQRAKEIVAKLQGKIGKFGLIKDKAYVSTEVKQIFADFQQEALDVLLQLQYKKNEAEKMIEDAINKDESIKTTEELLNQIYNNRVG